MILADLLAGCQALVFPGEEDFGMIPVEAMAAGRPVIGLGKGGLLETVVDVKTGLFVAEPNAASLIDAVSRFSVRDFDPAKLSKHAAKFSRERFKKEMEKFVAAKMAE